jgi:3-oxocholest-4-en-26-oate---CoA ligase
LTAQRLHDSDIDSAELAYHYVHTLRHLAHSRPGELAVAAPHRQLTNRQLVARAESLAGYLRSRGIERGTPVATMAANSAEIIETFYAALILGASPTNINPRYTADEVRHVLEDCQAGAIVYEQGSAAVVAGALAGIKRPLEAIQTGSATWDQAITHGVHVVRELSGDDRLLIYTGGTTGLPRAVEWRVTDHYRMIWQMVRRDAPPPTPEFTVEADRRAPTALPCSPILHGVGLSLMLNTLNGGGTVVVSDGLGFNAATTLRLVAEREVAVLGIVGDAFARPLLTELESGRWAGRLPSLRAISSAGAVWSTTIRDRMSELLPGVRLISNFGSTEALVARDIANGVSFEPGSDMIVLGPDGGPAQPGQVGIVATTGFLPVGYLGDPDKTAQTFRMIDGRRFAVTGDEARVESDGRITLLGRGTAVINTGGEKVWPEEVEATLRSNPHVLDVAVVGRDDERWGQRVTALVQMTSDSQVSDEQLTAVCREKLAPYKCPKDWLRVDAIPRTPVGKPDYRAIQAMLKET